MNRNSKSSVSTSPLLIFIIISLPFLMLSLAGDIEENPGPYKPKFPCKYCDKAARWNQKCLQCDLCKSWYHVNCLGMSSSLFEEHVEHPSHSWICSKGCGMPQFWNMSSSLFLKSPTTPSDLDNNFSHFSTSPSSPRPTDRPPPSATSTPTVFFPGLTQTNSHNDSSVSNDTLSSNTSSIRPIPKNSNELTIISANCEGVTGKSASLEHMLTSLEPDVFLAVESKLDSSISDSEFLPPAYRTSPPFRKDRVRGGGGVFIATREGIIAEPLTDLSTDCEICWIRVRLESNSSVIIGVFYTPQADIESLVELRNSLLKVKETYPNVPLFLGGDFNLPGINWDSLTHTPMSPKNNRVSTSYKFLLISTLNRSTLNPLVETTSWTYSSPPVLT